MQQGPDLVGGGYPTGRPIQALLGGAQNVYQPNVPVATNLDFELGGLGAGPALPANASIAAIPVVVGTVISRVSVLCSGAATAPTHAYAALYSGTAPPALLGQSVDSVAAVVFVANARTDFTLAIPVTITPAMAPFGFVYAVVESTATTTQPSVVTLAAATGAQAQWYPNGPLVLLGTVAGQNSTTANATLGAITATATGPLVVLA